MPDDISICNMALSKIGIQAITSFDEASQPARFCALHYDQTRNEVLELNFWSFAMDRVTLSRLADAPAFEWAYQYQLPTDFLALYQLNSWSENEARDLCEVEAGKLLTDSEKAEIRYTKRIVDSTLFPPLFVEALVVKLASKLIKPLTGGNNGDLLTEFTRLTEPLAARANARRGKPRRKLPFVESDFVRSRYGV